MSLTSDLIKVQPAGVLKTSVIGVPDAPIPYSIAIKILLSVVAPVLIVTAAPVGSAP